MSRQVITKALFTLSLCLAAVSSAQGADPSGPVPKEGRIYNLDSKPFSFRLARIRGASWSDTFTLAPGESYTLRTGEGGNSEDLEGITGNGTGHVTIDYPELGGRIRLQLPAVNHAAQVYMPSWFHVRDSNGFSRVVQAADKQAAEAHRKALLAEPPFTPAELAAVKRMLRANFMLTDR